MNADAVAPAGDGAGAGACLLCGVGMLALLVPTGMIVQVGTSGSRDAEDPPPEPLDLRILPGAGGNSAVDGRARTDEAGPGEDESPRIDVRLGAATRRLRVDWIGHIETVAPEEFVAIPPLFGLARQYFDAACIRPFSGSHPLRLAMAPPAVARPAGQDAIGPL